MRLTLLQILAPSSTVILARTDAEALMTSSASLRSDANSKSPTVPLPIPCILTRFVGAMLPDVAPPLYYAASPQVGRATALHNCALEARASYTT